jgi:Phorbol esters/diacylglycerol binding domain (C1 domain)
MKQDVYLDVLEVVAYNGALTRRKAMSVLATFWPKALGHIITGKPLPVFGYSDTISTQPSSNVWFAKVNREHPYAHEFMPWRFSHSDSSSLDYGVLHNCCQSCSTPIIGFGLLCSFCCVRVHVNCYDTPDGTFHGQYLPPSETDPRPYFLSFSNILPSRKDSEPQITRKADHSFRLANLFSMALCLICHKPLWGYVMQGWKCTGCHQFVHASCMAADLGVFPRCEDEPLSSGNVFIDWSVLRETFVEHYRQVLLTEEDLTKRNYEEISIYYSVLWAQLCILDNGISYRSIIVSQKDPKVLAKENFVDDFELQYFVRLYEVYLSSYRLAISPALQEFLEFNKLACPNEHCILFDWSLLSSVTSVIKMPLSSHPQPLSTPSDLLHVSDPEVAAPVDATFHPYEIVRLSHLRDALGHEFHIYLDYAAQYMLSHIHQIGLVDRVDASRDLFDDLTPSDALCSFPLPSGLDLSTSVETLVVAIDACLRDIDIAINEYGFLLLVRRFASTGAASEYALSRLTKMVLSWIFAEDDRLIVVAREYVAHKHSLPGVRSVSDPSPWPPTPTPRYNTQATVNSGGEYVSCRKQLLARHAIPWLFSVHELDATLYSDYLYGYCADVAEASHNVAGSLYLSNVESNVEMVRTHRLYS